LTAPAGGIGAIPAAISGGLLMGASEFALHPIHKLIGESEWGRAKAASTSTLDKYKLLAATMAPDIPVMAMTAKLPGIRQMMAGAEQIMTKSPTGEDILFANQMYKKGRAGMTGLGTSLENWSDLGKVFDTVEKVQGQAARPPGPDAWEAYARSLAEEQGVATPDLFGNPLVKEGLPPKGPPPEGTPPTGGGGPYSPPGGGPPIPPAPTIPPGRGKWTLGDTLNSIKTAQEKQRIANTDSKTLFTELSPEGVEEVLSRPAPIAEATKVVAEEDSLLKRQRDYEISQGWIEGIKTKTERARIALDEKLQRDYEARQAKAAKNRETFSPKIAENIGVEEGAAKVEEVKGKIGQYKQEQEAFFDELNKQGSGESLPEDFGMYPKSLGAAAYGETKEFQAAVKRRNIEKDGSIWSGGQNIRPTDKVTANIIQGVEKDIAERQNIIDKLSALPVGSKGDLVRRVLPGDTRLYEREEAILDLKSRIRSSQRYIDDIKLANSLENDRSLSYKDIGHESKESFMKDYTENAQHAQGETQDEYIQRIYCTLK
jgi:hypothetical protein